MHREIDREIPAVYVEFCVRRERKRDILPVRIFDLPQHNIGGNVHLQGSGNEELVFGSVGVDVKTVDHAKIQGYLGLCPTLRADR